MRRSPARACASHPSRALPNTAGLAACRCPLLPPQQLAAHIAVFDAAQNGSHQEGAGVGGELHEQHSLLGPGALPPSLANWLVDVSEIEYLRWPNGALQELGRGSRCAARAAGCPVFGTWVGPAADRAFVPQTSAALALLPDPARPHPACPLQRGGVQGALPRRAGGGQGGGAGALAKRAGAVRDGEAPCMLRCAGRKQWRCCAGALEHEARLRPANACCCASTRPSCGAGGGAAASAAARQHHHFVRRVPGRPPGYPAHGACSSAVQRAHARLSLGAARRCWA